MKDRDLPEIGVAEVMLLVIGVATVVMGSLLMAAALSPASVERRRAARRRDLEDELERLRKEEEK